MITPASPGSTRPSSFRIPSLRLALRMLALLSTAVLLAGCATRPVSPHGGFVERQVEVAGKTHRYQVFVPAGHGRGRMPVILFLHGSGERGEDNQLQMKVGLPPHLRKHLDDFPAIVVIPQAPAETEWTQEAGTIALAALDASMKEFDGDPDRVYLTGLSMGGYGTWELALQQPQRFAALVPICGGLTVDWTDQRPSMVAHSVANAPDPFAEAARRLKHVPAWIFHGGKDDLVPPVQSRRMEAALKQAGGDVRYTEFPDANHNSWDPAYATPELWTWLFQQHR